MPITVLSTQQFIDLFSLEPEEDLLAQWLNDQGLLGQETKDRITEANLLLPLDIEYDLKERFKNKFDDDCLKLFNKLLKSDNGIKLKELGLSVGTCRDCLTCTGKLLKLKLAKVVEHRTLIVSDFGLDPRIQFLINARVTPY